MTDRARRPWYSPIRLLQRAGIYVVVAYVTLCVFLYFTQDAQIYPGAVRPLETGRAIHFAAARHLVPWTDAVSGAPEGYVRFDFNNAAPRGTIVVFHGNGQTAYDRDYYVDAFRQRGFRTFLYEYPGYGGRPGHPREATIVPDARALIRKLDRKGLGPVYVWGESLGSGVAASVVGDPSLPVHGLTLMMPWDTIAHVATYRFPFIWASLLMHDRYDTVGNLENFHHPVCVIRGDSDSIIPPALTLNLFAHLRNPKLMILEAGYGHGDWPSEVGETWWDEALDFIAPKAKS